MQEVEISCAEAKDEHGVISNHGRMDNGELRFRLQKNDGTAYIRTESPPEGGWQASHWHEKVKETYIVQEGWIGYAALRNGRPHFEVYQKDAIFTTAPSEIHNIYMPAGAVIHTVKHGDPLGENRLVDDRTEKFNSLIHGISESDLQNMAKQSIQNKRAFEYQTDYSEGYRHFDNLIWQVPAWSSAIFAVVLAGTSGLDSNDVVVTKIGIPPERILSYLYGLFGIFILVLSHALYRFRWHQIGTKNYTPENPLLSPQLGLQFIVNVQSFVLFVLSFLLGGLSLGAFFGVLGLLFVGLSILQETNIVREGRSGNRPIKTQS